jgi:hypothetical protein
MHFLKIGSFKQILIYFDLRIIKRSSVTRFALFGITLCDDITTLTVGALMAFASVLDDGSTGLHVAEVSNRGPCYEAMVLKLDTIAFVATICTSSGVERVVQLVGLLSTITT